MKKDNSTLRRKVLLRHNALRELTSRSIQPSILESHGGNGRIWSQCYSFLPCGVVFETDEKKAASLAVQRPNWSVYETDCVPAMEAGAGFHLQPNYFDIDPYGDAWPAIRAIFSQSVKWQWPAVFAVNCGLRGKLKVRGGWLAESVANAVREFGNDCLYENYLDVCRWMLDALTASIGRKVRRWTGYYCGVSSDITHWAAVIE